MSKDTLSSEREEKMTKKLLQMKRKLNPLDIKLPPGYKIEVFAQGLNTPINLIFTDNDQMLVADAGVISGSGKVLRFTNKASR